MKKKLTLMLSSAIVLVFNSRAQDTARTLLPDTTSDINFYLGLAGTGFIQTDSGQLTKWAQVRVGAHMKKNITKNLLFNGWIGYDPGQNNTLFRASLHTLWKNGGVSVGYQPTPVSEIRPYPFSIQSQIEFVAESMIPGGALGTTIWYKNWRGGVYVREGKPEYQITYQSEIFSWGLWTPGTELGGITAKVELPQLYFMATVTGENQQGVVVSGQPFKTIPYKIVWDFATKSCKVINNFIAIQYDFKTKEFTKARCGIGYNSLSHEVGAYLLMELKFKQ